MKIISSSLMTRTLILGVISIVSIATIVSIMTILIPSITAYDDSFLEEDCEDVPDHISHQTCNDVQYLNSIILEQQDTINIINNTLNDVTAKIDELIALYYPDEEIPSIIPEIFTFTLTTDKESYDEGEEIEFSGTIFDYESSIITFLLTSPDNMVILFNTIFPDENGDYSKSILPSNYGMGEVGTYTIDATYQGETLQTTVQYGKIEILPVPEILPLLELPTISDNVELAPNTPEIDYVIATNESVSVGFDIITEGIDTRYEEYPTNVLELSIDGVDWYIGDERQLTMYYILQLANYSVENYVEYLVRMYTYNEFGNSTNSLIWSGIPTEFIENSKIDRIDTTDEYVKIYWDDVNTFSHTPLYWIIEKSTNYEEFKVVEPSYYLSEEWGENDYTDYDVISGNIYSYRVTMVTDFETQIRSGFASILVS